MQIEKKNNNNKERFITFNNLKKSRVEKQKLTIKKSKRRVQ